MKYSHILASSFVLIAFFVAAAVWCTPATSSNTAATIAAVTPTPDFATAEGSDDEFDGKEIVKTDAEWRAVLTPEQYHVLREEGTDPPFRSQYNDNHEHGDYYCAACHLKLFSSKTKFESGTGWPSFYQPINTKNVVERVDQALGVTRTEIECARCKSHLGHVFDDGPKPTGLRYCMNGTALKFEKN